VPTAIVNGVRLNYVQTDDGGDGAREDLVMVHGLATNLAFWYFQYAAEFSTRFRVTMLDLRGHGRSEMPAGGYSPTDMARDLGGLLDHLGIAKAHFIAHSFGGVVALKLACQQPERVRSLVLADSHIAAVRRLGPPLDWAYGQGIQPILDRLGLDLDTRHPYFGYHLITCMAQWQLDGTEVPAELAELVSPLMGKSTKQTARQWLALMETTSAKAQMMGDDGLALEELRKLRFPILALYGEKSHARLTGEVLLEVWPQAEFRGVRDAGHFFPSSRPQEVISDCKRFWGGEFSAERRRNRDGETPRNYIRTDRVFAVDDAWYFMTREKCRMGPFATREEALAEIQSMFAPATAAVPA
jgi:pimeloyl-ACP methyl ester carboxylesterase